MIRSYRKIFDLLDDRERRQLYGLVALTMVMGVLEVAGVAAVLPFFALVADPSTIETNRLVAALHDLSGVEDANAFLILTGALVFIIVLVTTLARAATFYALTYFTRMRTLSLARRLLERYMQQPYVWFLRRHSADLGKTILSEVGQVVNGPVAASLRLIAHSITMVFMVLFLLALKPEAALGAALLLSGSYGLIFVLTRRKLSRIGKERVVANQERYQVLQEAMGGIKNVKLVGLEQTYLDRFTAPAHRLARRQASLAIISEMPRHLLEVIAFGGMVLFVLWMLITNQGMLSDVLPILGVFAVASARLFPTIQQLFASISAMRFGEAALDGLHQELTDAPAGDFARGGDLPATPLRRELRLENVEFAFPGAGRPSLRNLSLTIEANTTVGVVGATGAGKTTLIDIILGLLQPTSGRLIIDGVEIDETNVRSWQKSVGYVPQDIFLIDDTIAANIAFGVGKDAIDHAAVREAARHARLHGFIEEELAEGYDTLVGERGARLSGGQRQRIGIARALYRNPDVLILDEATSALDTITEKAVLDAVEALGRRRTIIMIAHRLTTVRRCDKIVMLEGGRLVANDAYDSLVAGHVRFREMHATAG